MVRIAAGRQTIRCYGASSRIQGTGTAFISIPAIQVGALLSIIGDIFQSNRRGELTVCPGIGSRIRLFRGQRLTCTGYVHSRDIGTLVHRRVDPVWDMVRHGVGCAEIYLQHTAIKSGDVIHRVGAVSGHAGASVLATQKFGVNALEHIAISRGQHQVGAVVLLIGEIDRDSALTYRELESFGPDGCGNTHHLVQSICISKGLHLSVQIDLNGDICAVMLRAAGVIVDQRVRCCCNNRTCTRGRFTVIGTAGIIVGRSINLDCGILIRQTPVKDVFVIGKLIRRRSSFGIFFTIQHRLGGQASHLNSLGRYLKPLCLSLSAPFLDIGQNSIAVQRHIMGTNTKILGGLIQLDGIGNSHLVIRIKYLVRVPSQGSIGSHVDGADRVVILVNRRGRSADYRNVLPHIVLDHGGQTVGDLSKDICQIICIRCSITFTTCLVCNGC